MSLNKRNNFFPLAIYNSLTDQDRFKWYGYGDVFAQPYEYKKIPPFQIKVNNNTSVTNAKLVKVSDDSETDITLELTTNQVTFSDQLPGGYYLLICDGVTLLDEGFVDWVGVDYGYYYLKFDHDGTTYYTEVFNWCQDLSNKIKITYSHDDYLPLTDRLISYQNNYKNIFYIDSELGKPEYESEEDAEERDGYKFSYYKVSFKKYRFTFLAPEYITDAIRFIWLHDNIDLEFKGDSFPVDSILFDVEWLENGHLGKIESEFTSDTVAVMTGRAQGALDVFDLPDTPITENTPSGEYNDDYNNDYNNI